MTRSYKFFFDFKNYFYDHFTGKFFILLKGESIRKSYVKQLNMPPLSTENCNATTNYAGSLPDDLICIDDTSDRNDTNCQINVSKRFVLNRFFEHLNECLQSI